MLFAKMVIYELSYPIKKKSRIGKFLGWNFPMYQQLTLAPDCTKDTIYKVNICTHYGYMG